MNHLLTITEQDIRPGTPQVDTSDFNHRQAARAVVLGPQGEVHLLHVTRRNYHKLPGGGVDSGEDIKTALERELFEEIGCSAEITGEVGIVVEYRDKWQLKQTSYCYLAKQTSPQAAPEFTDLERSEGFAEITMPSIDAAITLLEQDTPTNYDGEFIQRRDVALLRAAKNILSE